MPFEHWFPTTILFEDSDNLELDTLRNLVDKQAEENPTANTTGHWSGFNKAELTNLHYNLEYKPLTEHINSLLDKYIEHCCWNIDLQQFKIDRMWANKYNGKEVARKHFHSGVLSGCFYLDAGHDIEFSNPLLNNRPEFLNTQVWTTSENIANANKIIYSGAPGRCLIWPSWMMHETVKKSNNSTRSIAFDIWGYSNHNYYLPRIHN
jgi:uncharacterized protein (TIGR02466 family)